MKTTAYEFFCFALSKLSFGQIQKLGSCIGNILWYILFSRKKIATRAIEQHLNKDQSSAETIARSSFSHTGRSFLEISLSRKTDWRFVQDSVQIENPDQLRHVLELDATFFEAHRIRYIDLLF